MERRIHVHLSLAYEPRAIRPWLVGAMLLLVVGDLASESVNLTTYYPSPCGVYAQMITTGNTYLARDTATTAGKVAIGTPTPNSSVNALLSVNGGIAVGDYGTSTYNTAPAKGLIVSGPVGIGKNNPGVALDVVGQVHVSGGVGSPKLVVLGTPTCTQSIVNNFPCAGGSSQYITWAPGIFLDDKNGSPNWWYSDPEVSTTTVGVAPGNTINTLYTAPPFYCCSK